MNFTNMINDLLQRGYTYRTIGDAVGMTEGNVRAMLSNPRQQPRWAVGDKLIELHKAVMSKCPRIDAVA